MIIALATETPLVTVERMHAMIAPLRVFMSHVDRAYMLGNEPLSVILVNREKRAPAGATTCVFMDESIDSTTLAHHYYDYVRQAPAYRVFAKNTSGLNAGSASAFESLCHEAAEAKCNGKVSLWHPHPTRPGVELAYENADPTQDTYEINVRGERWLAANFITPHWYRKDLVGRPSMVAQLAQQFGYGLDWCNRLKTPGEIGPEGYALFRQKRPDGSYERWAEDKSGRLSLDSIKLRSKQGSMSRTWRILASDTP